MDDLLDEEKPTQFEKELEQSRGEFPWFEAIYYGIAVVLLYLYFAG